MGERGRRNPPLPKEIAIYDLRRIGDWEDVPGTTREVATDVAPFESLGRTTSDGTEGQGRDTGETGEEDEGSHVRTLRKFDFRITDFAVDPGQDLLVVVETRQVPLRNDRLRDAC